MKKNLPFYSHYNHSHSHPKFKTLRSKYGWEGEGKFWALNNMIAQAEDCWLDLNKEYNRGSIAADLNFTIEDFNEFVKFACKTCNLLIAQKGKISTRIIQDDYARVAENREKARYRKVRGNVAENQDSSLEFSDSSDEQNKRKEKSRVDKNKIDIHKLYGDIIPAFTQLNNDAFHKIYFQWMEYRKEIKKPLKSKSVIEQQIKFLSVQKDPAAVIEKSIQNQWQGLFEIKEEDGKKTTTSINGNSSSDKKGARIKRNLEAAERLLHRVTTEP